MNKTAENAEIPKSHVWMQSLRVIRKLKQRHSGCTASYKSSTQVSLELSGSAEQTSTEDGAA